MKAGFYSMIAADGIRKNKRMYIPYIITCQMCVCMLYLIQALSDNPFIQGMPGGGSTVFILNLGTVVIGLFSLLFLFYTNAFLLRKRKKEFGLYCVLGMDRHSVGRVLLWETLITLLVSLVAGLVFGIAFSKLGELLLLRLTGETARNGFFFSVRALSVTLGVFAIIFTLLLLNGIRQVRFGTVVSLLRSENTGEKAPKGNILIALLGLLLLIPAYYLAVSIRQPLTALLLFFAAVLMVIAATYLLMISGSVTLCRLLQKNKRYYYRTKHFVSVSSMAFRMKRNGAGLASVCILATMVLVMISSTACLYFGADSALNSHYPREICVKVECLPENIGSVRAFYTHLINDIAGETGATLTGVLDQHDASITGMLRGNTAILNENEAGLLDYENVVSFCFVDAHELDSLSTELPALPDGAVLVYSPHYRLKTDILYLEENAYPVAGRLDRLDREGADSADAVPVVYLVVNDLTEAVRPLMQKVSSYGEPALTAEWRYCFDTGLSYDDQLTLLHRIREGFASVMDRQLSIGYGISCRETEKTDYFVSFGGFFFLGIMLSIVFLMAAAVIIYYKQLSEGYEDRERFTIMKKVGMTAGDIRKSINSQMLTVFFFPLILAVIHLAFAFPMLYRMLSLFYVTDLPLLIRTTLISVGAFALFYVFVYRTTANVYYRLVTTDSK